MERNTSSPIQLILSLNLEGFIETGHRISVSLYQESKRWSTGGGEARGEKKTRGKVRRGVYRGPLGKTGICWRLALAVLQRFIGATLSTRVTKPATAARKQEQKNRLERFARAFPPPPPPLSTGRTNERTNPRDRFFPPRTYTYRTVCVLLGMRLENRNRQKEPVAFIVQGHHTVRPVQPIPLRLAPSPFRSESTPPTSSSCPPPPTLSPSLFHQPFAPLFPTLARPLARSFATAILPSRFFVSFILL